MLTFRISCNRRSAPDGLDDERDLRRGGFRWQRPGFEPFGPVDDPGRADRHHRHVVRSGFGDKKRRDTIHCDEAVERHIVAGTVTIRRMIALGYMPILHHLVTILHLRRFGPRHSSCLRRNLHEQAETEAEQPKKADRFHLTILYRQAEERKPIASRPFVTTHQLLIRLAGGLLCRKKAALDRCLLSGGMICRTFHSKMRAQADRPMLRNCPRILRYSAIGFKRILQMRVPEMPSNQYVT